MFAIWAIVLIFCAQLIVDYLTFALMGQVNPVRDPVSDYVFHGAGGPLFPVAVLLLIAGGVAVAAGAKQVSVPRELVTQVLFGLWCAGLLLVATFHGNRTSNDPTVHGEIHRFGGAVFLTCLPLAGWRLARSLAAERRWAGPARWMRWTALLGVVTAAAFGASQIITWLPAGLLERFALVAELLMLVTLAVTVRWAARWG
jgi:hypothetical protein